LGKVDSDTCDQVALTFRDLINLLSEPADRGDFVARADERIG
jgi:hypothetical protein